MYEYCWLFCRLCCCGVLLCCRNSHDSFVVSHFSQLALIGLQLLTGKLACTSLFDQKNKSKGKCVMEMPGGPSFPLSIKACIWPTAIGNLSMKPELT